MVRQGVAMNVPQMRMDEAVFLDWAETQEGRCEFASGRVVMMAGVSRTHGRTDGNLDSALRQRIDPARWEIQADFGVDVAPGTLRDDMNSALAI
jgi:hypothetical protein